MTCFTNNPPIVRRDNFSVIDLIGKRKCAESVGLEIMSYFFLAENAMFHWSRWSQFSNITNDDENYSRTTNISESVNSVINKNFSRKLKFEGTVQNLYRSTKKFHQKLFAYKPRAFLNHAQASKKRGIRRSDDQRLREIYEAIRVFNLLDMSVQLETVKSFCIEVGSKRRKRYEDRNIVFEDQTLE